MVSISLATQPQAKRSAGCKSNFPSLYSNRDQSRPLVTKAHSDLLHSCLCAPCSPLHSNDGHLKPGGFESPFAWPTCSITQHEGEAKETWKPMDQAGQDEVRRSVYAKLPYGAGELVRTCTQITKVCFHDFHTIQTVTSAPKRALFNELLVLTRFVLPCVCSAFLVLSLSTAFMIALSCRVGIVVASCCSVMPLIPRVR